MISAPGLWPRKKAGSATETQIDFRCLGGIVMMRLRMLLQATSASREAMRSRYSFQISSAPGTTSAKVARMKLAMSWRSTASSAPGGRSSAHMALFNGGLLGDHPLAEGVEQGHVGRAALVSGYARSSPGLIAALGLVQQLDDQLGCTGIAAGGLVGHLLGGRFELGDGALLAVLGHRHLLGQRRANDIRDIARAFRPTGGVARATLLEPGRDGRTAAADVVVR